MPFFIFGMRVALRKIKIAKEKRAMRRPKYITEIEVSEITGRALSTLRNERSKGEGITYIKVGRSVRYDLQDVIEFMEAHKIITEKFWKK